MSRVLHSLELSCSASSAVNHCSDLARVQVGLMAFAYGQLAQSFVVLGGYVWYFWRRIGKQGDSKITDEDRLPFTSFGELLPSIGALPVQVVNLVATFSWQSVEKLLLTEGEKFVLKFTETLVHQGSFSVVSSLGRCLCHASHPLCLTNRRLVGGTLPLSASGRGELQPLQQAAGGREVQGGPQQSGLQPRHVRRYSRDARQVHVSHWCVLPMAVQARLALLTLF